MTARAWPARKLKGISTRCSSTSTCRGSVIQEFGKRRPDLSVIVLSSSEDPGDVRNALAAGALGYAPKSATAQTRLSALRLVLFGSIYVPPLMLNAAPPSTANPRSYGGGVASLSARHSNWRRAAASPFRGEASKKAAWLSLSPSMRDHKRGFRETLPFRRSVQGAAVGCSP